VVFAVGEQTQDDTDSVRNLLLATRASMPQLASLNKLKHMTAKQQILYDSGMEDEAHKQMNIAYQTFMKGKDEGVLAEYDALNTTMTEEQDALVDYADEMAVSLLSVITLPLSPCFAALPVSRFDIWTLLLV
jgi:hypothetical protein